MCSKNLTCHCLVDLFYQPTKRRSANQKKKKNTFTHLFSRNDEVSSLKLRISIYRDSVVCYVKHLFAFLRKTIAKCSIKHILNWPKFGFSDQNKAIQTTLNWLCSLFNRPSVDHFLSFVVAKRTYLTEWMQIIQYIWSETHVSGKIDLLAHFAQ